MMNPPRMIIQPKNLFIPANLSHDANTTRDEDRSVQVPHCSEMLFMARIRKTNHTPMRIGYSPKNIITVNIPEDDRFKPELSSKVKWTELVPKLRESQSHELKPTTLNSIHETYMRLIDLKNTIHVFTLSQFLQFMSIDWPFVKLKYSCSSSCRFLCPDQFKCTAIVLIKLDGEKGLFYLSYPQ
ncbi:unnamed protein product [Ambrosiozyma monospora]|uniref:Unnamed protein product n=1 Tax=Ambrosiozyma monospora TaxID=43982 RepID=A0ACB5TRN0_AMBMO|nr:unnamed protein product [Ambrosiozyma monospora]